MEEGLWAVFQDPRNAVQTALDFPAVLAADADTRDLPLRVAIHRGPAIVATINGQLDYFGKAVKAVRELLAQARSTEWVTTAGIAGDPSVAELVNQRMLIGEISQLDLPHEPRAIVHRFALEV